jgi:hypothetical protein
MIRWSLVPVCVLALVPAACSGGDGGTTEAAPPPEPATTQQTRPSLPGPTATFAAYTSVPLADPAAPAYAGPPASESLDAVSIAPELREALAAPRVTETLLRQGFVVVPADMRLFHFAYDGNLYGGWPVFVTTDVAFHDWHLVFDKVLRSLEQEVLLPKLEALATGWLEGAAAQTAELAGTALEDDASRVEQLLQVAAAELGVAVELGPLAEREKALVDAHSEAAERSPTLESVTDYSLFTPRGHYTRNDDLRRYFTAMSVLGQSSFCLPGATDCPGAAPARRAILASRALARRPDLMALWRDLYEPTAFLVGFSDDYTPLEIADAVASLEDATALAADETVAEVVARLASARPVRIDPERASVRLMGTRFVLDSFVLDQLIYPNVGTADEPRLVPSALDLAAAFGSEFAYGVLEAAGATAYAGYDAQLERLREAIAARPAEHWGSTVYDGWLYALQPLFGPHGAAFPEFMRSDAWAAKAHGTGLASYAELKHDTILYTKQAVAEGGDGGKIPERRNWVEPEPVAFARLAAVAELLRSGLADRGLLTEEAAGLLQDLGGLLSFLQRIARDELAGAPISKADNDRLTAIGGELEALYWRSSDRLREGAPEIDQDTAVIADIASSSAAVLEVATGRIDRIYVLVPDDQGDFEVAAGGVYTFYEFAAPPGTRLTDEEWRASLDEGTAPDPPAWTRAARGG